MDKQEIIKKTAEHAKKFFEGEGSGHDLFHTQRVWKTAKYLAEKENADLFVVEMAALLHDVADWKLNDGDEKAGLQKVQTWIEQNGVERNELEHILKIIDNMSFSRETEGKKIDTIEGFVVQDADRLDAIGAVGIARTMTYGGKHGRILHDPEIKPKTFDNIEEYKKYKTTTINHFYEKLLLLKDKMNTEAAKKIAGKRHKFMEDFLKEFYEEWECSPR